MILSFVVQFSRIALILHHQGINRDIRKRDLEEKYELVVEANDKILERVVSLANIYFIKLSTKSQ